MADENKTAPTEEMTAENTETKDILQQAGEQALAAEAADAIMQKYDKESAFRRLEGFGQKLVFIICIAWSCFQLYTGFFRHLPVHPAAGAPPGGRHVPGLPAVSCLRKTGQNHSLL
jgi:uncharacterized protein (UPF0305 family)